MPASTALAFASASMALRMVWPASIAPVGVQCESRRRNSGSPPLAASAWKAGSWSATVRPAAFSVATMRAFRFSVPGAGPKSAGRCCGYTCSFRGVTVNTTCTSFAAITLPARASMSVKRSTSFWKEGSKRSQRKYSQSSLPTTVPVSSARREGDTSAASSAAERLVLAQRAVVMRVMVVEGSSLRT